jgi:putative transposase
MANTYTHLTYHCVWSTKNRKALILPKVESQIWAIVAETAKTHGMFVKKANGIENHIHVLIEIPKTLSVSEAMKRLKGGSSNAIQQSGLINKEFAWQIGYAAFTVSKSAVPDVSPIYLIKEIIIESKHLKRRLSPCWKSTKLILIQNTFSINDRSLRDEGFCEPLTTG